MPRALFTDATNRVACPKCGQTKRNRCRYPSGRKREYPHHERVDALQNTPGFDITNYMVITTPLIDALRERGYTLEDVRHARQVD